MRPTIRQLAYAGLGLAGLVLTWTFNIRFTAASGGRFSVVEFVESGFVNDAAASISCDILVATLVFLVWSFVEARRLRIRHWWVFLVLTFTVAFAVAFPAFLYVREGRLRSMEQ